MEIKNIHSVVDLITNSSTVIYTQATTGSINTIKEIINTILDIGGSKLKADDLFNFHIKYNIDFEYEEWLAEILNEYSNQNILDQYMKICNPNMITTIDCCNVELTQKFCPTCGESRENRLYQANQSNQRDYRETEKEFKEYLESIGFDESKIISILIKYEYRNNYNSSLILTPIAGINAPDNLGEKLASLFDSFEVNDF